ncbi:hypothetical protein [Pseudonocardia sp. EV170527-09]|uniref:hypothetical protein n=1 Tax=Pseudonocardia sp. EV170527-09 TaxID=2603411 RepID=UPI001386D543|nr:hypothetical protein [Pseudonocardia sp. EV170527-09]
MSSKRDDVVARLLLVELVSGAEVDRRRPAAAHPNGWTETTNLSMPVGIDRRC